MGGVRLGGATAGIAVAGMPLLAGSPTASTLPGGSGSRVQMERVETIYSDGQHNGFTSLASWRGKFYVAFRAAAAHATPWDEGWEQFDLKPGRIVLLESSDLHRWQPTVVLNTPHDDRDPKLLATKDRLFVFATSITGPATTTFPQQTFMVSTTDGQQWTNPVDVYTENYGFWQPKTLGGRHYVAADVDVTPPGSSRRLMQVELLSSTDGERWRSESVITRDGKRTETSLVFLEDDSLLAIVRQNDVRIAKPPYTDWQGVGADEGERYKIMPIGIPGPAAVRIGETVLVICRGRKQEFPDDQPGQYRTSVFLLDRSDMSLEWQGNLPTEWGGDQSYAGILPTADGRVLVSYYDGELYESGVPKRSDVKLATLRVR